MLLAVEHLGEKAGGGTGFLYEEVLRNQKVLLHSPVERVVDSDVFHSFTNKCQIWREREEKIGKIASVAMINCQTLFFSMIVMF